MKNTLLKLKTLLLYISIFFVISANAQTTDSIAVPSNIIITTVDSKNVELTWDRVSGASQYIVRFQVKNSNSWNRQSSSNTIEKLSQLLPGTEYLVKIKAVNDNVEGNYSQTIPFTTSSVSGCGTPNSYFFTSDNITANSCLIGWKSISGTNSYNIQYYIKDSNSPATTATSNTNSMQLSGLTPSTKYEFKVQCVCSGSTGDFSSSGIFTTKNLSCGPPDVLSAFDVGESTAFAIWNEVDCAQYYLINYRESGGVWETDSTVTGDYEITGLHGNTLCDYNVQSVDIDGNISDVSPIFSFTTSIPSCAIPSSVNDTNITTNEANILWDSIPAALSYNVFYRMVDSTSWISMNVTTNNVKLTGLNSDTKYEYHVQTVCSSGPGGFSPLASFTTETPVVSNLIPVPDHIVICVVENKAFSQIIGSSAAPHINVLANDSMTAVFTKSFGITHPSQPNYIHLFSGGGQGVTSNNTPSQHFITPNLAKELLNAGLTFVSYSDGLPSVGYDGGTSGNYARKHNPVSNWVGSGTNQVPSNLNKPFTSFPSNFDSLPTVSMVIPDLVHSMHNGSLAASVTNGDTWIYNNLNAYIQWAKTHNSLFILTTDEDDGSHLNQVLTLFTGDMVVHKSSVQSINHYNILRTIEEMYNLNYIGNSANVSPIHDVWKSGFRRGVRIINSTNNVIINTNEWNIYPNPAKNEVNVSYTLISEMPVIIKIYNNIGKKVFEAPLGIVESGEHKFNIPLQSDYPSGIYFLHVSYGENNFIHKFQVIK